ncbi:hypothetical protein FRC01_001863, partial [Tulasnella sp. 417]
GFSVPPPFDPDSPGDCYLESKDGTRFRVLRHVLVQSSPYFEKLLSDLPTPTPPDLPIFKIDENPSTLHALLIVLYPVHTTDFLDAPLLLELGDRQEKYLIPETAMLLAVSKVVGFNARGGATLRHPMELYASTWRFGFPKESQLFSRYTHSIDLMDEKIVETLRELALDNIIEALEPRKHICSSHLASDKMFFVVVSMIKTAARHALQTPYPVCADAISFLGLQAPGERTVTWCSSCYKAADRARLTTQLQEAIGKYPQMTSTVPEIDVWSF